MSKLYDEHVAPYRPVGPASHVYSDGNIMPSNKGEGGKLDFVPHMQNSYEQLSKPIDAQETHTEDGTRVDKEWENIIHNAFMKEAEADATDTATMSMLYDNIKDDPTKLQKVFDGTTEELVRMSPGLAKLEQETYESYGEVGTSFEELFGMGLDKLRKSRKHSQNLQAMREKIKQRMGEFNE